MGNNQVFKKYYSHLAKEGMLKGLICGAIIGCLVSILVAFLAIRVNHDGILPSIGFAVLATVLTAPVFYVLFFRPKTKKIAERIDRLGMEERMITMMELENDDSYIAMRQREDAKNKINYINANQLKISLFRVPIVALALLMVSSVAMLVVSANSVDSMLEKEGTEINYEEDKIIILKVEVDKYDYYFLEYLAIGGGYIVGDRYQVVIAGQDATTIVATPYDGFGFNTWINDGSNDPERTDKEIYRNDTYFGYFQPVNNEEPEPDPNKPPTEGNANDPNLIIDGSIYYGDEEVFNDYFNKAMEQLVNGQDVPPELVEFLLQYFEAIK